MVPKNCKRLTEVKSPIADDCRDCYWLYIVRNHTTRPDHQEPIKDPGSPRHEVTKMAHYYLSVDALTKTMQLRKQSPGYGGKK